MNTNCHTPSDEHIYAAKHWQLPIKKKKLNYQMLNDNELYIVLIEPELYWTFPSVWMTFGLLWDPSHSVKCVAVTLSNKIW